MNDAPEDRSPPTQPLISPELCKGILSSIEGHVFLSLNEQGEIVGCLNDCQELLGFRQNQLLGRHYSSLLAGAEAAGQRHDKLLESKLALASQKQVIRSEDGSHFLASLTLICDPGESKRGQNIKSVLVLKVVSERGQDDETERTESTESTHNSNESLLQSNFDLLQFAYVASHDLQEPLRTVVGFCDLINAKNKGKLDAETERHLGIITANVNRMQRLIGDLLEYAKVDAPDISTSEVSLNRPLKQAIAALGSAIKTSGAQITYDELPVVAGNSTQISLLFQNLLANAIKFRSELPPLIHISCKTSEGKHHVSVTDQGIGLDMHDADRIFSLLQRLHSRDQYEGAGIGLALCKRIAQRHGATISVDSSPGKGCTFTIVFDELSRGSEN